MATAIRQSVQDTPNTRWPSMRGMVAWIVAILPRHLARLSDIRLRRNQSQGDSHTTDNAERAERRDGIGDEDPAGDGAASGDIADARVSRPKGKKRRRTDNQTTPHRTKGSRPKGKGRRGEEAIRGTYKGPKSRDRADMPRTMAAKKAKAEARAEAKAQSHAGAKAAAKASRRPR